MRLALAAFVALFAAGNALAADDEEKIQDLERGWADALVSKDIAALDYLLHPDFHLLSLFLPPPVAVDRREYLERQFLDPGWAFESTTPRDVDVELRGEIALATVEMEVGWPGGLIRHSSYRFTDVWVRDAAGWRIISRFSEYR